MRHYFQPENSSTCGQHCVAMIAGITPELSIQLFGSAGGTRTKQVSAVLNELGYRCEDKLTRFTSDTLYKLKGVQIVKIKWLNAKHTHWVVVEDNWVYCSGHGIFPFDGEHMSSIEGVATSYLNIEM